MYESVDKASKLLASQLKAQDVSRHISGIRDRKGRVVTNQREINNVFKEFYENLYSEEGQMDLNKTNAFFRQLKLPKLSEDGAKNLEGPITLEELNKAINLSSTGKTPGIDGIPNEFYKKFSGY